jgi:hypothetical protein
VPATSEKIQARRRPDGLAMYGADNGNAQGGLEKYAIVDGPAMVLYPSPANGDYDTCGQLWISDDGMRIYTRCANVFSASDMMAEDMLYAGSFEGVARVNSVDHQQDLGRVAAIEGGPSADDPADGVRVHLFGDEFLTPEETIPLVQASHQGDCYPVHGRYVFWRSDGSELYVLGEVDQAAALTEPWVLLPVL